MRAATGLDVDVSPAIDVSCAGLPAIGTYQFRDRSEIESFCSEIFPLNFRLMVSGQQVAAESERQGARIVTLAQAMGLVVC